MAWFNHQLPGTLNTIFFRLFQLDDSKSLHKKGLFHQTSIKKWLFRVPGRNHIWIIAISKGYWYHWDKPGPSVFRSEEFSQIPSHVNVKSKEVIRQNLGGGLKHFLFTPYLGKWSNLTNIFQRGWNHQLENCFFKLFAVKLTMGFEKTFPASTKCSSNIFSASKMHIWTVIKHLVVSCM